MLSNLRIHFCIPLISGPKPLKCFTPPPEPPRQESSSGEEESGSEEESEASEEQANHKVQDEDLLEVSLLESVYLEF